MQSRKCRAVAVSLVIFVVGLTCPAWSLADSISWGPDADGSWETDANWAPNPPGVFDDVTIDVGGATVRTITIGAGAPSIQSLACEEDLVLSGGNLTIGSGGGAINGALTVGANRTLTVNAGAAFSANGAVTADTARLIANAGATFALPGLTALDGLNVFNTDTLLKADGPGSQLDLSNVAALSGGMGFSAEVHVEALAGGGIDLSAVPAINTGAVWVRADGAGSTVDLTILTAFTDTNANGASQLEARNGGTILVGNLTTLDFVNLIVGPTGTIDTVQIAAYTNSTATADGQTPDFSGMTNIQNSSFHAKNGSTITLPGITAYAPDNIFNVNRSLKASGASSLLDLSNFTALSGADGFASAVRLEALTGGKVDLSQIGSITTGAVWVKADGASSVVDLTALTTFTDTNINGASQLEARNGGTIIVPNLTTIDAVNLIIGATGVINTAQIETFTNATATADGATPDFSGMTNVQNSNFHAMGGGTITLPGITSYVPDDIFNVDRSLKASEASSLLDLSNFTTLAGTDGFAAEVRIEALSGGTVDLSSIAAVNTGAVWVKADGTNSVVDFSALAAFTDTNANGASRLFASNGGTVLLNQAGATSLTDVNVVLDPTGTISGQAIELLEGSTLSGSGALAAGLTNTAGSVTPGTSAGAATVNGDFAQATDGTLVIEIFGIAAEEFDSLAVLGNATLGGMLDVQLDAAFDLGPGMDFQIMSIDGSRVGQFIGLGQGDTVLNDNGFDLFINYNAGDGNDVVLTTTAVVPEPMGLGVVGLALLAVRRKRS